MADDSSAATGGDTGKRRQLSGEVAAYVRGLIMSGAVRPGEFLRMEPIADAVRVSNTPVREGLLALHSEGAVRLVPRRGFVVAPFSDQDVRDLFWVQAQLAGELAARAAINMTSDQLKVIVATHARHEHALQALDLDQVSELGHEFHRHINRAAKSHRLALLLGSIVKQLPNEFYVGIEGHAAATERHHRRLVVAMRSKDAEAARGVMRDHVLEGAQLLIETLLQRGVFGRPQEFTY